MEEKGYYNSQIVIINIFYNMHMTYDVITKHQHQPS